jgi:hypothetical protein
MLIIFSATECGQDHDCEQKCIVTALGYVEQQERVQRKGERMEGKARSSLDL